MLHSKDVNNTVLEDSPMMTQRTKKPTTSRRIIASPSIDKIKHFQPLFTHLNSTRESDINNPSYEISKDLFDYLSLENKLMSRTLPKTKIQSTNSTFKKTLQNLKFTYGKSIPLYKVEKNKT